MGAGEPTLDDHSFRCVMERLGVETEVRKSSLVLLEQRVDAIVAIPNFAGGDDLVTGMRKYCDAAVELVRVLGRHVLLHLRLPLLERREIGRASCRESVRLQ